MITGPNIEKEGLVFGYDTGYGIADNSTATRFYKGRPTVNLATDTLIQGGWSGTYSVTNSATKSFNATLYIPSGGSSWRTWYYSVSSYVGQTITITLDFSVVTDISNAFRDISVGQGNTGTYPHHIAGSAAIDRVKTTSSDPQRLTWTGLINSTGIVGFNVWSANGVVGNDVVVNLSNIQVEVTNHATPFTLGSRSNTDALIDLKKSTNIDLSNVSFDSTGQPTFDGTDDSINMGNPATVQLKKNFTIEAIVKPEQYKWMYFFDKGYGSNNCLTFGRHANDSWFFTTMIGGSYQYISFGSSEVGKWCHLVATYDGVNIKVYENSVLRSTAAATHDMLTSGDSLMIGGSGRKWVGDIPVVKLLSKVLTAEEVKQNFNAYKNRFNL